MSIRQRPLTGFSPSMTSCSKELKPAPHSNTPLQITTRTPIWRQISNLSFCRFTRRYWGNPCWFLFLRLLICLSSAGIPTWSEVTHKKNLWVKDKYNISQSKRDFFNYYVQLGKDHTAYEFVDSNFLRLLAQNNPSKRAWVGGSWRSDRHALWNTIRRNVRSKIQWFTRFCNSHYVSHFTAFFIDARA